eukprot:gnl/TRDRNA2_/TRDRNA2_93240_c1_seq1.p1 gnl/TRDRNA2_/TRDRNA2_93240_c1~~gnl/TRDRNA2_/TRDRNA2_93240_c1_seq1.p1  ORF type:complete len:152 (+),score=16.17 gnl/TRDRNA2_/TRDRNA2_93240_c1_seq1:194-649(+)
MYSTCNDEFVKVPSDADGGFMIYDLFCPCFRHGDETYVDFSDAAAALQMTATHVAVQGVNDGTVASRSLPSAGGGVRNMHQMGARATGSSSSDECSALPTSGPSSNSPDSSDSTGEFSTSRCARAAPLVSLVLATAIISTSWYVALSAERG